MASLTTAERIDAVERIINYVFRDKSLLVKALEAAGATTAREGNKPLGLVGDAVLKVVLYEIGYEDQASTNDMTNVQKTRASNENLARIGFSLGLDACIQLSRAAQGVVQMKLMATTLEAIVGAVYLDSNRDMMVLRALIIHLGINPTLE